MSSCAVTLDSAITRCIAVEFVPAMMMFHNSLGFFSPMITDSCVGGVVCAAAGRYQRGGRISNQAIRAGESSTLLSNKPRFYFVFELI